MNKLIIGCFITFFFSCAIQKKTIQNNLLIIDTVNDLKNLNNDINLVVVKGYYYDGDGGGGIFYRSKEDLKEDGGIIFRGNKCTWTRAGNEPNNGALFGIVDNNKFHINIDANIANFLKYNYVNKYNKVSFPKGIFKINKSIEIPEGLLIEGKGMGTTIIVADGNFSAFNMNYNTSLIYSGVKDLEIQTSAKPNNNPAISFDNKILNDNRAAHYFEVDRVKITSYFNDSDARFDVGILSRYWLGRITNCFISRVNKIGIHLHGDENNPNKHSIQTVIVDNNIIGTITDAKDGIGISVNKADGAVIIQNNNIEGQQKTGIRISHSKNLTLFNNYFESSIKGVSVTNLKLYESAYINLIGGFFTSGDQNHPNINYSVENCRDINMIGINTNYSKVEIQNGYINFFGGMNDTDYILKTAKGQIRFNNVYDIKTSKIITQ